MLQAKNKQIDIAIYMVTYNHENYIGQSIEGVINQKTKYSFKLFIGEDCSTDNTKTICLRYQNRYPELVEVISTQTNNLKQNVNNIFNKCFESPARYIAMCEGDDYWTDPKKLQKQVDFLGANPEYAICFHAVNILEDGKIKRAELNPSNKEETYSIKDIAKANFIYPHSVVFRNGLIEKWPSWFKKAAAGDYVLHMLNAKKGLLKYLPETMAVYRKHTDSYWASKQHSEVIIKWLDVLDYLMTEDFEPVVIQNLQEQKKRLLNEYLEWLVSENKYTLVEEAIKKYCDKNENGSSGFITSLLINKINSLENQLQGLQSTKSYKLARKLSTLKNKFS